MDEKKMDLITNKLRAFLDKNVDESIDQINILMNLLQESWEDLYSQSFGDSEEDDLDFGDDEEEDDDDDEPEKEEEILDEEKVLRDAKKIIQRKNPNKEPVGKLPNVMKREV